MDFIVVLARERTIVENAYLRCAAQKASQGQSATKEHLNVTRSNKVIERLSWPSGKTLGVKLERAGGDSPRCGPLGNAGLKVRSVSALPCDSGQHMKKSIVHFSQEGWLFPAAGNPGNLVVDVVH